MPLVTREPLSWVCKANGRLAFVARIWRWRLAIEIASNRRPILSEFLLSEILKRNLLELTGDHRDVPLVAT
jgi:hypothetical protein